MIGSQLRIGMFAATSLLALAALSVGCGDDTTETGSSSPGTTSSATGAGGGGGEGGGTGGAGGAACAPNPEVPAGTVRGMISYTGTKYPAMDADTNVYVALMKEFPPMTMPAGIAIISPMGGPIKFPVEYEITDAKPGDYYVFAFIDMTPKAPSTPDMTDPQGITPNPMPPPSADQQANVTDCAGEVVDVTITDP